MSILGKRRYDGGFYPQRQTRPFIRAQGYTRNPITYEQKLRTALMRNRAMRIRNQPAALRSFGKEIKGVDFPVNTVTFDTTGNIGSINMIQAGSSYFNRIGRRIEMKSVHFKGEITLVSGVQSTTTDYTRIILVYDRQTNGALPAIADIIQTTSQAGTNTTTSFSGTNLNYRDRFIILKDIKLVLPEVTQANGVVSTTAMIDPMHCFNNIEFFIPLKSLVTQFRADSSPAVIGDIATGGLYLVFFGSIANATAMWQCSWETRLRFHDN